MNNFVLIVLLILIIYNIIKYVKRKEKIKKLNLNKYGSWALITGASSGLGKEFAIAIAKHGVNCILVGRNIEQLELVSQQLKQQASIQTQCIQIDLSTNEGIANLIEEIKRLDIAILVNNAGRGYVGHMYTQSTQILQQLVTLNCTAPVALTSAILPKMYEKRKGAIIFVSSTSAFQPIPLHAVYSASKSFISQLGIALWDECSQASKTGIDIVTVEPGTIIDTQFRTSSGTQPHGGIKAQKVVQAALTALALKDHSIIPGCFDKLRAIIVSLLPRAFVASLARKRTQRLIINQIKSN
eukprot:TRINITY_DN2575_c2_g1_i1.p1 TRINITY_DN2575_c2_g1~~TRINITY_DN2575_c2_g1_i1.p1  ORF type:complete len:298 (+),score=132.49 TRINITY_DN2575_c2_g1_i1:63-956(+)